jgi:phasin family protein
MAHDIQANMNKMIKSGEALVALGQGNFQALVKSGQIWAAGVQDLGKSMAATAQTNFSATAASVKSFAAVKSARELADLQAAFARNALTQTFAETTKLTEATRKLAADALAPITAHVTLATEKFAHVA